jgi:hypothetical protein
MAVMFSALRALNALPPGTFLVLFYVRSWVNPRVIVRLEALGKLKQCNDFIGNWTHNLPACSIVPQPSCRMCLVLSNMYRHEHRAHERSCRQCVLAPFVFTCCLQATSSRVWAPASPWLWRLVHLSSSRSCSSEASFWTTGICHHLRVTLSCQEIRALNSN